MKQTTIFIISISVILMFTSEMLSQNDDKKLQNENPPFIIEFPAKYKLEESSIDQGLKTELYRTEYNDEVYMFKYTEHKNPTVSGENEFYMNASIESFVTGIKGTLIKKSKFKYGKTNGSEAFISIDNKSMNVFYRVLIIKRVQYQLIVITKSEGKTTEANSFFNSFICHVK